MLNGFAKFYKIERKQREIMLNTISLSLTICSGNERGPRNELGGTRRTEQFPHFGNYTVTPVDCGRPLEKNCSGVKYYR